MASFVARVLLITLVSFTSFALAEEAPLFFESDGIDIHYTDSLGEGLPVVLLHGFTMDLGMWNHTEIPSSLASDGYRVIAIDLRGHGKSDKPTSPEDYGPKVGKDVINLLDHLSIPKAHLIGYSMGAFVTGRLLITHPNRIYSATLVSGTFPVDSEEERQFNEYVAKDMEEHGDIHFASIARGWSYDFVSTEDISEIAVPIQAVFGSEEQGEAYNHQKEILKLPKFSSPIMIIEGADHDSEKAAVLRPELLSAVRAFIDSKTSLCGNQTSLRPAACPH